MTRLALLLAAGLVLAPVAVAVAAPSTYWQRDITPADRKRLARLWEAWTRSLNQSQAAGQGAALAALGPVVVPDAAAMNADADDVVAARVAGPLPTAGSYRCRLVKMGQREGGMAPPAAAMVTVGAPGACRITAQGDGLRFEQQAGPERLVGRLYPDGDRFVFLGTTKLAGETAAIHYGADPDRDAVGALRAMDGGKWRLELPWPNWQANLAIVEISPA
ncbi:DUF4893 domain-containing protein [Polymorphobacter fuscus]|uniref:DUF4893 domain-containing protein n=1 Tax=Sandarakinorhabdus fusca TaxID=1439888 RepID=A0A7C9GPQ8_9SPHN|nr:DUF4893 domain-containing protein [Polymorphobacter fuscus]KAB7646511.1 DUF4893 domain-containing protein [Polymorphobacter fuscus]MQT17755.1 DUF4893 domain-containing protein [Polymorphobacter fuscus]NJC09697.1 hypothetical protein [Polymorphobacter fuscus]